MKLCSSRTWNVIIALALLLIIVLSIMIYYISQSLVALFALLVTCCPVFILLWIATGRTIYLDSAGILVSFLWCKKKYAWDKMKTKSIFDDTTVIGYRIVYNSGLEFSQKKVSRPVWLKPFQYCVLVHPFSYIVIHFKPDSHPNIDYPAIFEADRNSLICLLNEWEVIKEEIGDDSSS